MEALPRALHPLDDTELARQAPLVRAIVAQRLEDVYKICAPHILGDVDRVDPRFVEAGIRALDRLTRLFRLDQPAAPLPDPDARPIDAATVVANGLRELEARIRGD